jgi:two-component system nitrogen regulation sensor histidine kinase GlnL
MSGDTLPQGFDAYDQLATMVAIARSDGHCLFANSTLENTLAVSRRALLRGNVLDWFVDPLPMRETLLALHRNEVISGRFEAQLKRAPLGLADALLVRVSVGPMDAADWALVEMVEIEQQTRQDREERALGLAQANKELLRNLAHEIKNPLGGIRGAAQLLEMELTSRPAGLPRLRVGALHGTKPSRSGVARGLSEYTQVIIHEADRLQALVDRLLAPHRKPHVVGDVNIHEVCERVRLLILAEFPRGLEVQRDYDTSIPEFRGDREQLIQAVLNIVRNATQALGEQIVAGSARLILRSRIARQVTIGRQRFRLALELHIQDNGPGVPESIRERIFQPLVSGREGGSGLGLTLAQTFVQQHQGTIEFDSVPGRTNFKILIPLP